MTSQENFERNLPFQMIPEAKLAIKDEYTFDFLELGEDHSERELERALSKNIEYFLKKLVMPIPLGLITSGIVVFLDYWING